MSATLHRMNRRWSHDAGNLIVRSAYRRDPNPDPFDCMGRVLGWPLVIAIGCWFTFVVLVWGLRALLGQ